MYLMYQTLLAIVVEMILSSKLIIVNHHSLWLITADGVVNRVTINPKNYHTIIELL